MSDNESYPYRSRHVLQRFNDDGSIEATWNERWIINRVPQDSELTIKIYVRSAMDRSHVIVCEYTKKVSEIKSNRDNVLELRPSARLQERWHLTLKVSHHFSLRLDSSLLL